MNRSQNESKRAPPPPPRRRAARRPLGERTTGRITANPLMTPQYGLAISRKPLFPLRSRVMRMNYYEDVSVTTGASSVGTQVYSANGIYDPNITGTGHQPSGFDQMMLMYNHYTVLKSRITATVRNASTTYGAFVAISARAGTSGITVAERLVENGLITAKFVTPKPNDGFTQYLTESINLKAFSGPDDLLDDHDYRGSNAANPAEQQYYHISAWNPDDATQVPLYVAILIEYDVVFTEPQDLVQS